MLLCFSARLYLSYVTSQGGSEMRTTGEVIKSYRAKKGFTQTELAKELGYSSAQFVSNWERGISDVPPKQIKPLSKLLGFRPERLYRALERDYSKRIRNS